MTEINLLPCPICNQPAVICVGNPDEYRIRCLDHKFVKGPWRPTVSTAAWAWNKLCTGSCNLETTPTNEIHPQ